MSEQDYIQQQLFPADSLASLSVLPGSEKARMMTVTSGRKCLELYRKSSQLGLLVKMLLESSIWHSTKCYLTWKVKTTPAKRLLFQLAVSMPHTDETGYLLLPTPTAADGAQGAIISEDDTFRETGNGTLRKVNRNGTDGSIGLGRLVQMWPTPTAREWKGARAPEALAAAGRNPTNTLGDAVRATESGQLNPTWVEWLMGFPLNYTEVD